jgi:hypothetical protein
MYNYQFSIPPTDSRRDSHNYSGVNDINVFFPAPYIRTGNCRLLSINTISKETQRATRKLENYRLFDPGTTTRSRPRNKCIPYVERKLWSFSSKQALAEQMRGLRVEHPRTKLASRLCCGGEARHTLNEAQSSFFEVTFRLYTVNSFDLFRFMHFSVYTCAPSLFGYESLLLSGLRVSDLSHVENPKSCQNPKSGKNPKYAVVSTKKSIYCTSVES